jgi:hypothetical protein
MLGCAWFNSFQPQTSCVLLAVTSRTLGLLRSESESIAADQTARPIILYYSCGQSPIPCIIEDESHVPTSTLAEFATDHSRVSNSVGANPSAGVLLLDTSLPSASFISAQPYVFAPSQSRRSGNPFVQLLSKILNRVFHEACSKVRHGVC